MRVALLALQVALEALQSNCSIKWWSWRSLIASRASASAVPRTTLFRHTLAWRAVKIWPTSEASPRCGQSRHGHRLGWPTGWVGSKISNWGWIGLWVVNFSRLDWIMKTGTHVYVWIRVQLCTCDYGTLGVRPLCRVWYKSYRCMGRSAGEWNVPTPFFM